MPSVPSRRKTLWVVAIVALLTCSFCASAQAAVHTLKPTKVGRANIVFRAGDLDPSTIRSARLRAGTYNRRLGANSVRPGARRGTVNVRAPKPVIRRLRKRRSAPAPGPGAAPAAPGAPDASLDVVVKPPPADPPASGNASCAPSDDVRYVSGSGSDSGPGTSAQPWRTLARALTDLPAGRTVIVRPGTYGARGTVNLVRSSGAQGAPVTIMGEPGAARPTILGQFRVSGNHVRACGLLFDGPTGPVVNGTASSNGGEDVQVFVYGDDVAIVGCEVRNNKWHAGIYLWDAARAQIVGNHIHHNGDRTDPAQANLDHGIYFGSGSGLVANNKVEDNVAYGVHLYPQTADVKVANNTITGNGKGGVILAEDVARTEIVGNLITGNREGIRSWDLRGSGNVARDNRVFGNWGGDLVNTKGIALQNNLSR